MTTYCTNLTTGASTRYDGYAFDSFCQGPDGKYYGIKADGIYRLDGDSDSGAEIVGRIDFGDINGSDPHFKMLVTAYAHLSSADLMELVIMNGDEEYAYPARNSGERMMAQRFDTGLGLRMNYYPTTIQNTNGCNFTLDSLELEFATSKRRI